MSINLEKGQRIKIGLQQIGVGLGWDPNNTGNGTDFDLDASVFMLGENGKLPADEFFVFYNNQESPDNAMNYPLPKGSGFQKDTLPRAARLPSSQLLRYNPHSVLPKNHFM